MGILQMLERRRIRKVFREYVSPERIAQLLREPHLLKKLETRHFQFVVILVDDKNPKEIPAANGRVVDTIINHGVTVLTITPSLLVIALGVPFPENDSVEKRRALVDALLREHADRIKLAHGQCEGEVGIMGGQTRFCYGAVIPQFSQILKALLETNFGTAVEIP